MVINDMKLPSNRNFGLFFTAVFFIVATYFFYKENHIVASLLSIVTIIFLITTLFKSDLLLPLNKTWMKFGLFLGIIISPIVMGFIFFGLITPYGIIMRVMGRDELRLRRISKESYWVRRLQSSLHINFKKQY